MYELRKKIDLQNIHFATLYDLLKNGMSSYNFHKDHDRIFFEYIDHSFGLYFNSFLLDGEMKQITEKNFLCRCSLKSKTKKGFYFLNGFIGFFIIIALVITPEITPKLLPIFLLICIALNLFAYIGLLISSMIFWFQLNKLIDNNQDQSSDS